MLALSGHAPTAVFQLIQRHQMECQALQSGTLRAAVHARDAAGVRATEGQRARLGAPVIVLERDEIERTTGATRYECALLDRRGGQVNPLGYARGLARAAMQVGAEVHSSTAALGVQCSGGYRQVQTLMGRVRAEKLVLATNGYTDDLWSGLRRSIVRVYSAIVASEPLPEPLARNIVPARHGHGIHVYRIDPQSGAWVLCQHVDGLANPSLFTVRNDGRVLFSVHGGRDHVSAFRINRSDGHLTLLSQMPCHGSNPVDAALDSDARHLVVANYSSGTVAVTPLAPDGRLPRHHRAFRGSR